eukprot:gnl/TRDRNA2_/TRDRNA2_192236_c0_seq1.p1 gnl/TRDRNA2_/TRDRNA2_192236_c0~~gnl/TRDRNA2_/TRDRNA2_192236_c0_seq1.p1  ORF type:complete len:609 (-),score=115.55 gnl/TRDRNA2_/TRDRNA2_192236_c0_seq1:36-1802(-)
MAIQPFRKGDDVYVFYRMDKRAVQGRRYMAVLDPRHGVYRPRAGLAEGWVPARVVADQDPSKNGGQVRIEYRWPHFYDCRGHLTDSSSEWTEMYKPSEVKRISEWPGAQSGLFLNPPGSRPELSILTFRWGGLNEIVAPDQWGETGSSVSETFLESFLDSAVVPRLTGSFEVWTVYVEDHSDLSKLADMAHLVFGANHPCRRAVRTCSMFFLYPTGFEENCVPTMETGEDHGAALVCQKALFKLMQAVERSGIPTRFPHCSGLYESLTSKRWTHQLALVPHLRVPATIAVPRMIVERNVSEASDRAFKTLNDVRRQQAILRGDTPPKQDLEKGVSKLGFSWEALDVKFWIGKPGLEDSLSQLCYAIEISQEMTGQPHDCESIIVQEYIQHDLELRVYVVDNKPEGLIYTKFCRIKENNEFGDFKQKFSRSEAAKDWFGGDQAALEDGEKKCIEVTKHWLNWVECQTCEPPPAIRFDYFLARTGQPGKAQVWTLEICELGFSMLGEKKLPQKVFSSMLRTMLSDNAVSIDGMSKGEDGKSSPPSTGKESEAQKRRRRKKANGGHTGEKDEEASSPASPQAAAPAEGGGS